MVIALGGKCSLCGLEDEIYIYDLHHINPLEKEINIASSMTNKMKVADEAEKCVLLCANCHRRVEHDKNEYQFISNFNRELFFDTIINLTGKLTNAQKLVIEEAKKQKKEKAEEYKPSRQELKDLIRTESFVSIGKQYKVSDNAVRKWCVKHGLPSKKQDINNYSDLEWLKL